MISLELCKLLVLSCQSDGMNDENLVFKELVWDYVMQIYNTSHFPEENS